MENKREKNFSDNSEISLPFLAPDAFTRLDESDDSLFYEKDRFVSHLDSLALHTVEKLISELVVEENPVILDLMAGWDSHLPKGLKPSRVVGLGLNERELAENKSLDEIVVKDINKDPGLPFEDETFDAVLNAVSVDYLVHPIEIFKEVGRILKPGGVFVVIFSNRMFPQKAVKVWRESSEQERILLVEDFFRASGRFERPTLFVSKGKPRPKDDKYAHGGLPSDPIYAFYADKIGKHTSSRTRPPLELGLFEMPEKEELEKRKREVKDTVCCPYCGEKLRKWAVPDNPFAFTWDNDFLYICFNDGCPYYVRGWDFMIKEGNSGSYRLMYNPEKESFCPIPVLTPGSLRESIID